MDNKEAVKDIVRAIRDQNAITTSASLDVFRDVYHTLKDSALVWLICFLGTQAYVQPYGLPNTYLLISSTNGQALRRFDFNFIPDEELHCFGSSEGDYSFITFLYDFSTKFRISVILGICTDIILLSYAYARSEALVTVLNGTIQAMSVFVAVFVVFIVNTTSDINYKYYKSGLIQKLQCTDKYIVILSVSSIFLSLLGLLLSSTFNIEPYHIFELNFIKLLQSILVALAILTAGISFAVMIWYHFDRRYGLANIEMAKITLKSQQDLLLRVLKEDS